MPTDDQPDLRELIDLAGAVAAATAALTHRLMNAEWELEGLDIRGRAVVGRAFGDVVDARFYIGRVVRSLRELL